MSMFGDSDEDRELVKAYRKQKQAWNDLNYSGRLAKMKKALPKAFFIEKPNNLVWIKISNKLFYWYPHKNIVRQQGVEQWSKYTRYTKIAELIKKLIKE